MLLYAWPAVAAAFVFVVLVRVAPPGGLWNARMLPFLYLFSLLVAACGASWWPPGWPGCCSGSWGCRCAAQWQWWRSWWWRR